MYDDTGVFGLEQGCPVHGEDAMRECSMCGGEFCRECYPTSICPECAEQQVEDEEQSPDFEDVQNLDELIGEDEEIEKLLLESDEEEAPPGALDEEER